MACATDKLLLHVLDEEIMLKWITALMPSSESIIGTNTISKRRATLRASAPDEDIDDGNKKEVGHGGTGFSRYMNKFMRARPAKDELKEQGIIQDTVFGGTVAGEVAKEMKLGISLMPGVPLVALQVFYFIFVISVNDFY